MHRVVVVVLPGIVPLDLGAAAQFFGHRHRDPTPARYELRLASADALPVESAAGFDIGVAGGLSELGEADTVIVPGYEDILTPLDPSVTQALLLAADRGCRMVSICTGAFALGHAGLLDGRSVTTHWAVAEQLGRLFPRATVLDNVLYTEDEWLFTSGGVAAGIDLCLQLVRLDFGAEVANQVARRTVIAPHRAGNQAQFVEPSPLHADSPAMSELLDWAQQRLDKPLSIALMAGRLGYSERTFGRQFRSQVGTTPWQWVVRQRLVKAQQLLEATNLSIDRVATECGFDSTVAFRRRFREHFQLSPTTYRHSFRIAVAVAPPVDDG